MKTGRPEIKGKKAVKTPMSEYRNPAQALERLRNIKLFALDMDGTIYLDSTPLAGAVEFCREIEKRRSLVYFTNNASKNPDDYVEKLTRIGFPASRKTIVTSGDVTIDFLKTFHPGEPVYLVGTPALEASFRDAGIVLADDAAIVVVSFDTTLTYAKLERACTLIRAGAKFYSTHPDVNCPTAAGFIPDSGAICAAIALSTGVEPQYFGKPNAETAEMLCRTSGFDRSEIAMVGDRLYTDIALGRKNGLLSILVMTGETTPEMLAAASGDEAPELVFGRVADILDYI